MTNHHIVLVDGLAATVHRLFFLLGGAHDVLHVEVNAVIAEQVETPVQQALRETAPAIAAAQSGP